MISILLLLILSVLHTNLFLSWLIGHTILQSLMPLSVPFCLAVQAVMQLVLLLLNPFAFSLIKHCYPFVSTSICIPIFACYSTADCTIHSTIVGWGSFEPSWFKKVLLFIMAAIIRAKTHLYFGLLAASILASVASLLVRRGNQLLTCKLLFGDSIMGSLRSTSLHPQYCILPSRFLAHH